MCSLTIECVLCSYLQIKDKVYDVSGWNEHPGANVIFTMAGEDATDVFAGACVPRMCPYVSYVCA